jgi:hypothetical protein
VSQQDLQDFRGASVGQRVESELGIIGLTTPAVLVLRAVAHQEEHLGGRKALDQAVQQGLGLGIAPVEIFKD